MKSLLDGVFQIVFVIPACVTLLTIAIVLCLLAGLLRQISYMLLLTATTIARFAKNTANLEIV